MNNPKNVVVIGAGPGGYVAAIRASQLGMNVTLIEREYIGGVCLNVGCIPSKALITVSHKYHEAQDLAQYCLEVPEVNIDFDKVQSYRAQAVERLTSGVEMLLKGNNVRIIRGEATFKDQHTLSVSQEDTTEEVTFDDIIIATGSRPRAIEGVSFNDKIISSTEALALSEVPKSMIVIGGGVIGIELATVYSHFGCDVTILEGEKNILPTINRKLSAVVAKRLKANGVNIHTNARVESSEINDDTVLIKASIKGKEEVFEAEYALLSIGRAPNTDQLNLAEAGVEVNDKGLIEVDSQNRTNISHIYAIGDIVPGPQLAHKASYEAKVAAEAIAGESTINDYYTMPSVVFSDPEIAVTGLSQDEAKELGLEVQSATFQYAGNGRAIAMGETDGFINILTDSASGKIIGGEIVGANASDLINELSLAIECGLSPEDIALTVHPHPTLGEMIMETAEVAIGNPIHTILKGSK